jgi:hypothetical protein
MPNLVAHSCHSKTTYWASSYSSLLAIHTWNTNDYKIGNFSLMDYFHLVYNEQNKMTINTNVFKKAKNHFKVLLFCGYHYIYVDKLICNLTIYIMNKQPLLCYRLRSHHDIWKNQYFPCNAF